jgi:DNA-binding GntR family transcriptional regulator
MRNTRCSKTGQAEMTMLKNQAQTQMATGANLPAHEVVYRQLRRRILFGDIAPGQAVTIQGLVETLGAGMTPVREAIRRLTSDGALEFLGNRRVCVPKLTPDSIEEIAFMRKSLEPELTRRAVCRVDEAQVEVLMKIDNGLDLAISNGDVNGYLEHNYRFHTTLYAMADAPVMAAVADRLWLRFGPSLRVVCGRFGTQNLPDKHHELLDALRARDSERAAQAMSDDVEQGMSQIGDVLEAVALRS